MHEAVLLLMSAACSCISMADVLFPSWHDHSVRVFEPFYALLTLMLLLSVLLLLVIVLLLVVLLLLLLLLPALLLLLYCYYNEAIRH